MGRSGPGGRAWSEAGQTTTEWLMIAGLLTGLVVFLLTIVPDALGMFVRGIATGVRTVAP